LVLLPFLCVFAEASDSQGKLQNCTFIPYQILYRHLSIHQGIPETLLFMWLRFSLARFVFRLKSNLYQMSTLRYYSASSYIQHLRPEKILTNLSLYTSS